MALEFNWGSAHRRWATVLGLSACAASSSMAGSAAAVQSLGATGFKVHTVVMLLAMQ